MSNQYSSESEDETKDMNVDINETCINSENEGINIPARENEISNLSDIPSQVCLTRIRRIVFRWDEIDEDKYLLSDSETELEVANATLGTDLAEWINQYQVKQCWR